MGVIIGGIITGLIAIVGFIYSFFLFNEKGPILTNTYILFSEEERKKMKINIHAEYKTTARIYFLLSLVFALVSLRIFTSWVWTFWVTIIIIITLLIYVIVNWLKTEKGNI